MVKLKKYIEKIVDSAADFFKVDRNYIFSNKRTWKYVLARFAIYNILNKKFKMKPSYISRCFNKNHTNILYSLKQLDNVMSVHPEIKQKINDFYKYCNKINNTNLMITRQDIEEFVETKNISKEQICVDIDKLLSSKYPETIFYVYPVAKEGPIRIIVYWYEGPTLYELKDLKSIERLNGNIDDIELILFRDFKPSNYYKSLLFFREHYPERNLEDLQILSKILLINQSFKGLINIKNIRLIKNKPVDPEELVLNTNDYVYIDYDDIKKLDYYDNTIYLSDSGTVLNVFYNKYDYNDRDKFHKLTDNGWQYNKKKLTVYNMATIDNINFLANVFNLPKEFVEYLKQHTRCNI